MSLIDGMEHCSIKYSLLLSMVVFGVYPELFDRRANTEIKNHSFTFRPTGNSEQPADLICMGLDRGRKPEHLGKPMQAQEGHTERLQSNWPQRVKPKTFFL